MARTVFYTLVMSMLLGQFSSAQTPPIDMPVRAQNWQICNETSYILNTATVTTPVGGDKTQTRVRGWSQIRSGQCQNVEAAPDTPRFVYARSDLVHQGNVKEWKGQHVYCIDEEDFVATPDIGCVLQNLKPAKFLQIVPEENKTRFVEPANYQSKAVTAGLQRLLRDNIYQITRIDGIDGRRTARSLVQFLKDQKLQNTLTLSEKFDALITAAYTRKTGLGVQFCNTTPSKIWAAIAYDEVHWWKSIGWWPIEPDACVQPFDRNLKTVDVFIHARQSMSDGTDKVLAIGDEDKSMRVFCVAESKFSAIEHDFCLDYGYAPAKFKALGRSQTGQKIEFTDADFSNPRVSELR